MKLSRYFSDLRSAYEAELDDLTSDSEGKDVLKKRLAAKRSEIGFLVQMLHHSPEMVAVVFHRGFRFAKPAAMQRLLTLQPEALPAWPELAGTVALESWAEPVARKVLAEAGGPAFMTVAACLEFLHAHGWAGADLSDGDTTEDADPGDDDDALSTDDALAPQDERSLDEAGADWLADQGFDRKD
ncbi:MAG: hypothetical protein M9919_10155 [Burkholderiaceae bacterium]|jgi:hypothetical protein|nr:hypothetical protein [Burkholderiaceae bacterium]MCO5104354.1 hypothetical protein [Burkholderiaceae bacterium]